MDFGITYTSYSLWQLYLTYTLYSRKAGGLSVRIIQPEDQLCNAGCAISTICMCSSVILSLLTASTFILDRLDDVELVCVGISSRRGRRVF